MPATRSTRVAGTGLHHTESRRARVLPPLAATKALFPRHTGGARGVMPATVARAERGKGAFTLRLIYVPLLSQ